MPSQTATQRGGPNNRKALAVCRHISSNDRAKTSVTILIIILVLSLVLLDVLTTRKTAVYDRHHEIPLDSLTYQLQTQPGQLYGQPPFQGMPPGSPYYTPTPNERPSKATAAATLGIVNGSLGILHAIATFLLLAVVFSNPRIRASAGSSYENTGFMLVSTEAICTLGIALTLLIGGIRFLQGKGRIALLIATFIQLPIVLVDTLFIFMGFSNPNNSSSGFLAVLLFMQLIGLVLPILMIVFLFNRDVGLWSNRAKTLA